MRNVHLFLIVLAITLVATPAFGYVGPGLGAGIIGVILGVLGAVLLALLTIIYYPIKRALKRVKASKQQQRRADEENDNGEKG